MPTLTRVGTVIWAIVGVSLGACTRSESPGTISRNVPEVAISLATSKDTYITGESLLFDVTITNHSTQSIEILVDGLQYTDIQFYVSVAGANMYSRYRISDIVPDIYPTVRLLPSGASHRYHYRIAHPFVSDDAPRHSTRHLPPGVYDIKVKYGTPSPTSATGGFMGTETNTLRINIIEPQDPTRIAI